MRILGGITRRVHNPQFHFTTSLKFSPRVGDINELLDPIWVKYYFIKIPNIIWSELDTIEVRGKFQDMVKYELGGWHILGLAEGRFVVAHNLIHTLGTTLHVLYLVEYYPRQLWIDLMRYFVGKWRHSQFTSCEKCFLVFSLLFNCVHTLDAIFMYLVMKYCLMFSLVFYGFNFWWQSI